MWNSVKLIRGHPFSLYYEYIINKFRHVWANQTTPNKNGSFSNVNLYATNEDDASLLPSTLRKKGLVL